MRFDVDSLGNFWGWNFPGREKPKEIKIHQNCSVESRDSHGSQKSPKSLGISSPNPGDHFGMNGGRKKTNSWNFPGLSSGGGKKKKSLWDILGFFFFPNSGLSQEKSLPGSRLQRPQIPIFSWNFSPPGKNGHEGDSG